MGITSYSSNTFTDSFRHIGLCAEENKPLEQIITIDDGTGKLYYYSLTKELTWREYTISPEFSTNPAEPSILDIATIIPNIYDPFDVVGYSSKDINHDNNTGDTLDIVLPVDYDFGQDGTKINKGEHEEVLLELTKPRSQDIKQTVRYFTGWKIKTAELTKSISKTNLPPEVCRILEENIYVVPVHTYLSCSTDFEDINPTTLTINWKLYRDINSTINITQDVDGNEIRTVIYDPNNIVWELVTETNNNPAFSWTYNEEGYYKIFEEVVDTDGASTDSETEFDISFGLVTSGNGSIEKPKGVIEVEASTWQLCAIPMKTGYWDKNFHRIVDDGVTKSTIQNIVIDQIEDIYNIPSNQLIKVINGYVGDENIFRNFIPGFTQDTSIHNFSLVFTDEDEDVAATGTKFEIAGFWIKAKALNFLIKWGA